MKLARTILLSVIPILAGEMLHGWNDRRAMRVQADIARERTDEINKQLGDAQRQIEALTKSSTTKPT